MKTSKQRITKQSGFTAVELLITLFVAAAFLIASYQLFNLIIKDSGAARSESRAGNVAYDYMRRYVGWATSPCTTQNPLTNSAVVTDGLADTTVSVDITCPVAYTVSTVSKIEVTVKYNTPQQTVKYATFTIGAAPTSNDITAGLIGWWKLNGDTDSSVGSYTGASVASPTLTTGQNSTPNSAYNFNGTSQYIHIQGGNFAGLNNTVNTLCGWGKSNTVASGMRVIAAYGDTASNQAIMIGMDGTSAVASFEGTSLTATGVWTVGTWHHICVSGPGKPTLSVDGTTRSTGPYGLNPTSGRLRIGAQSATPTNYWNGAIDDVRVYDRVFPPQNIQSIYNSGAK